MGVQLSCNRECRDRGSNGRRPPLLFYCLSAWGKVVAKNSNGIFSQGSRQGTSHRPPPVHGRPGPKSDAGGGPFFHTRAGRLGGVAYPDTPGEWFSGSDQLPGKTETGKSRFKCDISREKQAAYITIWAKGLI